MNHALLKATAFTLKGVNLSSLPSFSILKYRNDPNLTSQIREANEIKICLGLFWVSVYIRDAAITTQWVIDPDRSKNLSLLNGAAWKMNTNIWKPNEIHM